MAKHLTKQDIKGPDLFQKEARTLVDFIIDHIKPIAWSVVALGCAGVGYVVYDYVNSRTETQAQVSLFEGRKKRDSLINQFQKEAEQKTAADAKDKKKLNTLKTETPPYTQDVATAYEQTLTKYPKSKAAALAAIELSDYYLEYNKKEEALAVLDKAKTSDNFHVALVKLQKARTFQENNKCQEAIGEWQWVLQKKDLNLWHSDALLKSGVCYEALNDKAKAKESYDRVINEFADSGAATQARKYKRLLDQRI